MDPADHDQHPGPMRLGHRGEAFHGRGLVGIGRETDDVGLEFRERPDERSIRRLLAGQIQDARFVRGRNATGDDFQGQWFQVKERLEPPCDFQRDRRADEKDLHHVQ